MDFQLDPGLVHVFQLPMKQIYEIIKNLRRSYLNTSYVVFANDICLPMIYFFSSVQFFLNKWLKKFLWTKTMQ